MGQMQVAKGDQVGSNLAEEAIITILYIEE